MPRKASGSYDPKATINKGTSVYPTDFLDMLVFRGVDLDRFNAQQARDIARLMIELRDDLEEILRGKHAAIFAGAATQRKLQLEDVVEQLNRSIRNTLGETESMIVSNAATVAQSDFKLVSDMLKGMGISGFIENTLPPLDSFIVAAQETFLQGTLVSEWFSKLEADTQQRIAQQLRLGWLAGDSIEEMVRRIFGRRAQAAEDAAARAAGAEGLVTPLGKVDAVRRNAEAIARTMVMTNVNNARRAAYAASGVVTGLEHLSAMDERTTEICTHYDGEKWAFEEGDVEDFLIAAEEPEEFGMPFSASTQEEDDRILAELKLDLEKFYQDQEALIEEAKAIHTVDLDQFGPVQLAGWQVRAQKNLEDQLVADSHFGNFIGGVMAHLQKYNAVAQTYFDAYDMSKLFGEDVDIDMAALRHSAMFVKSLFGNNFNLKEYVFASDELRSFGYPGEQVARMAQTSYFGLGSSIAFDLVHEFGHMVEMNNPWIEEESRREIDRRAAEDVDTGSGWEGFLTSEGDTLTPYFRRSYGEGSSGTEMLASSLEAMFANPAAFAREDPWTFLWLTGIILRAQRDSDEAGSWAAALGD